MINSPIDIKINPFQNIANSLTSLVTYSTPIPPVWNYSVINLILTGGLTPAMISEIRLIVNGDIIQRFSGTELDNMNQYNNAPAAEIVTNSLYVLSMYQERLGIRGGAEGFDPGPPARVISGSAKDLALETTLNCGSYDSQKRGISSVTIECDINNTPASGTLQITPQGWGYEPYPGGAGLLKVINKTTFNAVDGQNVMTKENGFKYGDLLHANFDQLFLVPVSGALDNFLFYFNNNIVRQRTDAYNRFVQKQNKVRVPQAGQYVIDMTEEGFGDQDLVFGPAGTTASLQFDDDTAGPVSVIQVSLGYLWAPTN